MKANGAYRIDELVICHIFRASELRRLNFVRFCSYFTVGCLLCLAGDLMRHCLNEKPHLGTLFCPTYTHTHARTQ